MRRPLSRNTTIHLIKSDICAINYYLIYLTSAFDSFECFSSSLSRTVSP